MKSKAITCFELIAILFIIVILLAILLPAFTTPRSGRRPSCQNNLKQWGFACAMYANESKGELLPPMEMELGCGKRACIAFGPLVSAVYPKYLTDPSIIFCLKDEVDRVQDFVDPTTHRFSLTEKVDGNRQQGVEAIDASYFYTCYVFDRLDAEYPRKSLDRLRELIEDFGNPIEEPFTEAPAQFVEAMENLFGKLQKHYQDGDAAKFRGEMDNNLEVSNGNGNGGEKTVYRLRKGIERFIITDINNPAATVQAEGSLFIMWDNIPGTGQPFNHTPPGCNVLYLDGHVAFLKYPGPPPVIDGPAAVMRAFDIQRDPPSHWRFWQ